jgi:CRISPR-associated endonuclease Cas1
MNDLLLYEARAAKHFWKQYKILIPAWTLFPGRRARAKDVANSLLDIGYHHLANVVKKILEEHDVTLAPALFHVAHREKSAPLVYDLMELFRADIVDTEVLKYLRLKRVPLGTLEQKNISHFIYRLNKRLEKKYFLTDFKQCHTYRYYMELQIIKFIKAVNHKEVFQPIHLPQRHDTRCACILPKPMV